MGKRHKLLIQVMLSEIDEMAELWHLESIHLEGTLDDLALLVASNATNNTVRQMAQRLITAERRGEWTE